MSTTDSYKNVHEYFFVIKMSDVYLNIEYNIIFVDEIYFCSFLFLLVFFGIYVNIN